MHYEENKEVIKPAPSNFARGMPSLLDFTVGNAHSTLQPPTAGNTSENKMGNKDPSDMNYSIIEVGGLTPN
jgi:hypothetical protein